MPLRAPLRRLPQVRDSLIVLLSSKQLSDITDFEGKALTTEMVRTYFGGRAEAKSFAVADHTIAGQPGRVLLAVASFRTAQRANELLASLARRGLPAFRCPTTPISGCAGARRGTASGPT